MADTSQIVSWALERECPLREGASVADIDAANDAVALAATYGRYLAKGHDTYYCFGVYGDVCVTSATMVLGKSLGLNQAAHVPRDGFVVSSAFSNVGGAAGLRELCGSCPANASGHPGGCVGSLYQAPDAPETQEQMASIIARLGMRGEVEELFPATTPLWYGLWTKSPLPRPALGVLGAIFRQMCIEDRAEIEARGAERRDLTHLRDIESFTAATQAAFENGLRLHVKLLPPGHTDFGMYTVFPHCPFCKAGARIALWQKHYPAALYTCQVCGTRYSPRDNALMRPMSDERDDLRTILGQEKYEAFALDCLVTNGHSAEAAQRIVQQARDDEARRQAIADENRRQSELQEQYRDECIYVGLPVKHWQSADGADAGKRVFGAADFEVVLDRCQKLGLKVVAMGHYSRREELEKSDFGKGRFGKGVTNPRAVMAAWRAEGCDEAFWALVGVSKEALEEWKKQKGER